MGLCLLVLGNALKVPGEEANGMTNYLAALAYLKYAKGAQKLTAEHFGGRKVLGQSSGRSAGQAWCCRSTMRVLLENGNPQKCLR